MADRVLTDTTNSPLKKRGAGEAGATQKLAQKKQKTQKGGNGVLQSLLESILYTSTNGMKWRQVPRHDHGHQSLARRQNGRDSKLLCLKGMVELLLAGSAHSFAKNVTKQTMQGFHLSLSKCVIGGLDSSKSPRVDGVSRYANTFYVDPGNPLYTALAVIVGDDSFTIPRGGKVQRISAIRGDGKCTVRLEAAPFTEGVVLHSALGVEVETKATRHFKRQIARDSELGVAMMSITGCSNADSFVLHRFRETLLQHPQLRANSPKPRKSTPSASSSPLIDAVASASASHCSTPPPLDSAQALPVTGKIISVAASRALNACTIVLPAPKQTGWPALAKAVSKAFGALGEPLPDGFHVGYYNDPENRIISCGSVLRHNDALVVRPAASTIVHEANMLGVAPELRNLVSEAASSSFVMHMLTGYCSGKIPKEDQAAAKVVMQGVAIYERNKKRNEQEARAAPLVLPVAAPAVAAVVVPVPI